MEEQREIARPPATTRLYDATLEGNVPSLFDLLLEDPLILERCTLIIQSSSTPLHVAAGLGHLAFAEEILSRNPDMCLARDRNGRNPAHVAALRGQVVVLERLIQANVLAARARTSEGDTVLHLCVKHGQHETLKHLVITMDDCELLNSKDGDGNTVLHLAVAAKQTAIVNFLLEQTRMEINAINTNGLTAMDTHIKTRKEASNGEILGALKRAKALQVKEASKPRDIHRNWIENKRTALMVVASLIATMAFQVGVNPPGGLWQQQGDSDSHTDTVGSPIMEDQQYKYKQYEKLVTYNTIALVTSLSVILLLISGLPCKKLFVVVLTVTMWIAVTATTTTYIGAVRIMLSSSQPQRTTEAIVSISITVWLLLLLLLLLGHVARLVVKLIKQLGRLLRR